MPKVQAIKQIKCFGVFETIIWLTKKQNKTKKKNE